MEKLLLTLAFVICLFGCDNNTKKGKLIDALTTDLMDTNQITAPIEQDNQDDTSAKNTTQGNNKEVAKIRLNGLVIAPSPSGGFTVCAVSSPNDACADDAPTDQTDANGNFSLAVSTYPRYLKATKTEGNVVTDYVLPVDENMTTTSWIISPLSTLIAYCDMPDYLAMKARLGIAEDIMIRTTNPFIDITTTPHQQLIKIHTQLAIVLQALNSLTATTAETGLLYQFSEYLKGINTIDFADTTQLKTLLTALTFDNNTQDQVIQNLSAVLSAFLQKLWIDEEQQFIEWVNTIQTRIPLLMTAIQNSTLDATERETVVFNTLDYLKSFMTDTNTEYADRESAFRLTTYQIDHQGADHFTVDGINAKTTALTLFARIGDRIVFEPKDSAVFTNHPFRLSTVANDTAGTADIGLDQGWDQTNFTLTVTAQTPTPLYPHCGYHADMFLQGGIQIVESYTQSNIDTDQRSGPLQVKGTVFTGPFMGASGYTHSVYLQPPENLTSHEHTFYEYPGLTFYMPEEQGYHGDKKQDALIEFKPKSHYSDAP